MQKPLLRIIKIHKTSRNSHSRTIKKRRERMFRRNNISRS